MSAINVWIETVTHSASDREIARKIDVSQSTLSRQRRDGTVTADTVVKIARAYQVSSIPALVALGLVEDSDIDMFFSETQLEDATDMQLAAEVLRRMKSGQADIMDQPISEIERQVSDLDSRRARKSTPKLTAEDLRDVPYAADSSPNELFPGDDGYGEGP